MKRLVPKSLVAADVRRLLRGSQSLLTSAATIEGALGPELGSGAPSPVRRPEHSADAPARASASRRFGEAALIRLWFRQSKPIRVTENPARTFTVFRRPLAGERGLLQVSGAKHGGAATNQMKR